MKLFGWRIQSIQLHYEVDQFFNITDRFAESGDTDLLLEHDQFNSKFQYGTIGSKTIYNPVLFIVLLQRVNEYINTPSFFCSPLNLAALEDYPCTHVISFICHYCMVFTYSHPVDLTRGQDQSIFFPEHELIMVKKRKTALYEKAVLSVWRAK